MRRAAIAALAGLALLVEGCGFTPLYATGGRSGIASDMREVTVTGVQGPPDAAYYVQGALRDVLPGDAPSQRYRLAIALRDQRRAVAVTEAADTTRYDYVLNASYTLQDTQTGDRRRSSLQTIVSYGVVDSQYASLVGREDAVRRAALDLARRLETDVALYLKDRAPEGSSVPLPPVIDDEPLDTLHEEDDVLDDDGGPVDAPAGEGAIGRP
ncbi:LPS assembly lipoprotein LptE [Parvularcula dongshanensis]|uniref:LPS-assembly lipoprotein n=1 Tax=Parvularcula dongshanensis TaxID=1173995 RepID=A0A840HZL6_9PROT|nr:LPS assembly lipoprotein LptE [Parvularcula dongshanensis]MBB4658019.1 LPS-assembly lipoprotein [Parvularcula dongshanensis]